MKQRILVLLLLLPLTLTLAISSDIPEIFAAPEYNLAAPESWWDEVNLISRLIMGEATGEPFAGQVGVGAVVLNRTRHPQFPNTVPGVIYEPGAFESVSNGLIWSGTPSAVHYRAAELALNGWDPTYGALFFWNPAKPVSPWIWTRTILTQIGSHVFAR